MLVTNAATWTWTGSGLLRIIVVVLTTLAVPLLLGFAVGSGLALLLWRLI